MSGRKHQKRVGRAKRAGWVGLINPLGLACKDRGHRGRGDSKKNKKTKKN